MRWNIFGDLVYNIAHDPAMINYLNLRKNVKGKPNEDFGRELLELFTVGVGKYSEQDVKEVARAFTGWRFKVKDGSFFIDEKTHDKGIKTFLGQSDYYAGEDILNIIFQQENTGEYIAAKIYHYLTGKEIEENYLKKISTLFYKSSYHIGTLVKTILSDEEFKSSKGKRVKSPIELLVGLIRFTGIQFEDAGFSFRIQRKLGQILGEPPNVSGWISGKQWLDLGSIAERINLTEKLLFKAKVQEMISFKKDPENIELMTEGENKPIKIIHELDEINLLFKEINDGSPAEVLSKLMLGNNYNQMQSLIEVYENKPLSKNMMALKKAIIRVASLPEYQLH